jgi:hypothetical protein
MAISARTTQFTELLKRFFALGQESFFESSPPFTDFDGPSVPELVVTLKFLRRTYEPLIATGELSLLTFNAISQLQSHLQNAFNTYDQLLKTRDQGSYQNCAIHVDQFANQTRMYGVPFLAEGGAQLETIRALLQAELDTAKANNADVERLKKEVNTLITPAVAGSLSQQFMKRRDTLVVGRYVWLAACVGLGIYATYATFDLVTSVTAALTPKVGAPSPTDTSFWSIAFLRTLILLPIFAAFGFSFAQYRKEREFEEEYAHKAAVAHSLPNYGDLAREPAVRDQIVTAASNVIFTSPTEQARKVESSNAMLGGMKEVVEALTKAVGKR